MLIVCPSCATSYMIDQASVEPAGRAVRCARCKTTWFASAPKTAPSVGAFVDGVIAEAEAESAEKRPNAKSESTPPPNATTKPDRAPVEADDFGGDDETFPPAPESETPPPFEQPTHNTDLAPRDDVAFEPVAISDAPSLVPPIEQEADPKTGDVHFDAVPFDSDHADSDHLDSDHLGSDHLGSDHSDSAEAESDDIETFSARRQRLKARRQKSRRTSRWAAIILVLFAFNVALIGARHEVVRYLPQTASLFSAIGLPVNLRNMKFDNVKISKEVQDGVNILIIEGMIVSTSGKPIEVPRLRFSARNATGQDVYTWTAIPSRSILGPGESMKFLSRLASPPADAVDIMVRFFSAKDAVAGAK